MGFTMSEEQQNAQDAVQKPAYTPADAMAELWGIGADDAPAAPDKQPKDVAPAAEEEPAPQDYDDTPPAPEKPLSALERVEKSKEKHKARADEAERRALLLEAENKKYQEALDAILAGKNTKEEPEEDEYIDEKLAKDTNAKLTQYEQQLQDAQYKIQVATSIAQFGVAQEFDKANEALILKSMQTTLDRLSITHGVDYDIASLSEDDFNELARHSIDEVEAIRRKQFAAGKDPVRYTIETARKLTKTSAPTLENSDKTATLNIAKLDSVRKSAGKPEVTREAMVTKSQDYANEYLKSIMV